MMAYYKVEDKNLNTLFENDDKDLVIDFFNKNFNSNMIQIYTQKGGATNGILQPNIPATIKVGRKTYKKCYIGFFTEEQTKGYTKENKTSKMKMIAKQFNHGYMLYGRLEK